MADLTIVLPEQPIFRSNIVKVVDIFNESGTYEYIIFPGGAKAFIIFMQDGELELTYDYTGKYDGALSNQVEKDYCFSGVNQVTKKEFPGGSPKIKFRYTIPGSICQVTAIY